jgi:hypothetical protein
MNYVCSQPAIESVVSQSLVNQLVSACQSVSHSVSQSVVSYIFVLKIRITRAQVALLGETSEHECLLLARHTNWVPGCFMRSTVSSLKMKSFLLREREICLSLSKLSKPFSCQPGSLPTPCNLLWFLFWATTKREREREREREDCPYKRFSNLLVHPLGYRKGWGWRKEREIFLKR